MKVAVVAQFFPPETFAGANRIAAIAGALGEVAEVTVCVPRPSYPDPSAYTGASEPSLPSGVALVRVSEMNRPRGGWTTRGSAEIALARRLGRAAASIRPDVVVASSPSMFLGPTALLAAHKAKARFVWDIRDLTWEYGRDTDLFSNPAARVAIGAVARAMWWTAHRADLVTCATQGLGDAVRPRLPDGRVEVVPNGLDAEVLTGIDPSPAAASQRLRILYAGLVGHAQALEVLLDLAERTPEVDIEIAGDGPRRKSLEDQVHARGLENIEFLGYQSRDDLARSYHRADILFAQLQKTDLHTATAAPSKLLEYMAAGRPIVYAGDGLAADFVERSGAGVVVASGDVAAIRDAILSLEKAERVRLGEVARRYAEAAPTRLEEMRRLATLVKSLE